VPDGRRRARSPWLFFPVTRRTGSGGVKPAPPLDGSVEVAGLPGACRRNFFFSRFFFL